MLHLQHAVVAWVQDNANLCEVIHGHEWGGMLVDLFTLVYFRRLQHGARSVVTPHGGHMWSMQWKPQRSFSVEPLRIDHQVCALSSDQGMTLAHSGVQCHRPHTAIHKAYQWMHNLTGRVHIHRLQSE